jgi:phage baseplate assembly protein W
MKSINIKFPLEDDKEKNSYFRLNNVTKDALTSNLILLLLTNKGERYYNPNYGTNLQQFIFEPKDNLTITEVEREIKQTVKDFIPELSIKTIQFFSNGDDDQGNPVGENELRVVVNFVYSEDTFSDTGRLELNF